MSDAKVIGIVERLDRLERTVHAILERDAERGARDKPTCKPGEICNLLALDDRISRWAWPTHSDWVGKTWDAPYRPTMDIELWFGERHSKDGYSDRVTLGRVTQGIISTLRVKRLHSLIMEHDLYHAWIDEMLKGHEGGLASLCVASPYARSKALVRVLDKRGL